MMQAGEVLDGYRVLRRIGAGGFGEVWLCQSEALGDYRALKFVPARDEEHLRKEFEALGRYRAAAGRLRSPAIMPIEHANVRADGLYYVMPLADGEGVCADPLAAEWRPLTLTALIESRRTAPAWFSAEEIKNVMAPILHALQLLSEAGLVHRDVKPDNILFLGGSPCLADISLLGEDHANLTRRGTPGFSAPSWYVESGGPPDMFGAATTLYAMLTGNPPDKLGRSAFRWPPLGEASLAAEERAEWLRLHGVIRRAVDERGSERFPDFMSMCRAVANESVSHGPTKLRLAPRLLVVAGVILAAGVGLAIWGQQEAPQGPKAAPTPPPSATPQPMPSTPPLSASPSPAPVVPESTPHIAATPDNVPAATPPPPSAEIRDEYRELLQKFHDRQSRRLKQTLPQPEEIIAAIDVAVAGLERFESLKPADPKQAVREFSEVHRQFAEVVDKLPQLTWEDVRAELVDFNTLERDLRRIAEGTGDITAYLWRVEPLLQEAHSRYANARSLDATLRSEQLDRLLNPLNKVSEKAAGSQNEELGAAVYQFRETADKLIQRY